jgi:hypothetical protein
MTNQKHFKAVHRETKEEIEFGIEDIASIKYNHEQDERLVCHAVYIDVYNCRNTNNQFLKNWLEDYELFYWHGGWHAYETN